jgi:DNA-binding transcriptional LysR family regulator
MAPQSTTSDTGPSRLRCTAWCSGTQRPFSPRPNAPSELEAVALAVRGSLFSNETAVLRQAALAGAGIALLPTYYVVEDLQRNALVRVLADHEPEPLGIHAVYLSRQHQPQALKRLIEFLAERFAGDVAPWDRDASVVGSDRRVRRPTRGAG